MHVVFIPYGMKKHVDYFLEELAHLKLPLRSYKDGEQDQKTLIECQLRVMPGGFYEFIFPKEYEAAALTTFLFHKPCAYNLDKKIMGFSLFKIIKDFLRIENAPKDFDTSKTLPIVADWVSIIPIGVRYDGEVTEADDWKHEAI
jgi:hypothetical protein